MPLQWDHSNSLLESNSKQMGSNFFPSFLPLSEVTSSKRIHAMALEALPNLVVEPIGAHWANLSSNSFNQCQMGVDTQAHRFWRNHLTGAAGNKLCIPVPRSNWFLYSNWLINEYYKLINGSRWSTMTSTTIEGSEKKLHQWTNHFQICFHRLPLSQCWFGLLGGFQATAGSVRHGRWIWIHRCTNQKIQLFQLNGSWLDETWSGTDYPGLSIFDRFLSAFVFQPEFIRNDEEKWREYKTSQSEKYCRLIWCKEQKRERAKERDGENREWNNPLRLSQFITYSIVTKILTAKPATWWINSASQINIVPSGNQGGCLHAPESLTPT